MEAQERPRPYAVPPEVMRPHRPWVVFLARDMGAEKVVEVGVHAGSLTIRLLRETDATVWAVDHWQGVPEDPLQAYMEEAGSIESRFLTRTKEYHGGGRLRVMRMDSVEAACRVLAQEGRTIDLVFIDADHRYEAVRDDIQAWLPCIRPGGILCGHDYHWPGVKRAVEELLPGHHADETTWWIEVTE
jgi:predicted O-methyltransferase YrrM